MPHAQITEFNHTSSRITTVMDGEHKRGLLCPMHKSHSLITHVVG